jgi:hypothetical protein
MTMRLTTMRMMLAATLALAVGPVVADTAAEPAPVPGSVQVTTTYSITVPLASSDPKASDAEDRAYRRRMYERSSAECADLLATVAKSCEILNVAISTSVTVAPGQANGLYATSSVTMQVAFR